MLMTQNDDSDLVADQPAAVGADGLPARPVGDWSADKHYYLRHYIEIFEKGMHQKWKSRAYIDLCSGPGICMYRGTKKLADGSPLIALKVEPPFTQYFFSDTDPEAIDALSKRTAPFKHKTEINIYQKDCNEVAAEIAKKISPDSLCLAFLDPTGLDLKLSTLKTLTQGKKMDLIIYFPHGLEIKRNIELYYAKDKSKMDEFFGGTEWREIYEKNPSNMIAELLALYKKKLAGISYLMEPSDAVVIYNATKVPLYALLFASKDRKGIEFWKKIMKIGSQGQRGLFD